LRFDFSSKNVPALALLFLMNCAEAPVAYAQGRVSDKDIVRLMTNLHEDVKKFREPFGKALQKSPIRKTTQEKDAKNLASRLEKDCQGMLNTFKSKKKADPQYQTVMSTAGQLDPIVQNLGTRSEANDRWDRVQADLKALAPAMGQ
jgi:hypothetical protein